MRKKYLVGPFICTFACWAYGNGTMPILPLYAMERGASQSSSGLFLAFAFLCLALGTVATGLLPKDFTYRKWLIAASGLLMVGLTWLISYTTTLIQFAGATGLNWFLAGVVFSQAATLTGLAADSTDRGMAFGILGMTNGLGSLIGGFGVGYVADHFGFTVVYKSIAAFCILVFIGGLISVESPGSLTARLGGGERSRRTAIGVLLVLLLASQLLQSVASATGGLGRSLAMARGGFSKFAINVTASIQGLVALCISLFLGRLSDKIGRRWIMIAMYLTVSASLVLLAFSRTAWQFYVFAGLCGFLGLSGLGPAYVMDLVPKERAARGISMFQSVIWAGNIVGMAAAGLAFEKLGTSATILFSSLFPIAGVILLLLIREQNRGV
jgi:MFS family permease